MTGKKRKQKKVLIIVENLPVPHDKRVWQEAQALARAGYKVAVISPRGKGYQKSFEIINDVSIYRHPIPLEARRALEYLIEYPAALFWEFILSLKVFFTHGFDVIQACNPPDTIFLIGLFYKIFFRKKFIFDHHDGNPEIWIAKGGGKGIVYKALMLLEKLTFKTADMSFAVNQPYKDLAVERGGMSPERVYIVRNSPNIKKPETIEKDKDIRGKNAKCIIGYLGVMGKQDGVDNLLEIMRYIVHGKKRNDIVLKIMGDGPELQYLKGLAMKLDIDSQVNFTGWVSGNDYISHLSSCDICVNADTVNEYNINCSPNKIYEYMFFKKPIVQFDMPESKYV
ncbi:MAG: glycosyltransferase family 4 protein, partial [Spirochaetes bacterium]|nr:glycosyltransferase family 4 protein [Spirochaetota bacterium]